MTKDLDPFAEDLSPELELRLEAEINLVRGTLRRDRHLLCTETICHVQARLHPVSMSAGESRSVWRATSPARRCTAITQCLLKLTGDIFPHTGVRAKVSIG